MTWSYPRTITNGEPPNAVPLQENLDYARRKINSVTDAEVAIISEGGSPPRIVFDEVSGHTHNGSDSSLGALAVSTTSTAGTVMVVQKTVNVDAISWSADLLTGTDITKIMSITVSLGSVGIAYMVGPDVNDRTYYVVVNTAGAVDEAYIFNGYNSTAGYTADGQDSSFRVLIVGI